MSHPIHIVLDENIPYAQEHFGAHGTLRTISGRDIENAHLKSHKNSASALIVRSVTAVDEALIQNTDVQFVGSCTIGTDHIDTNYLDAHGIHWASAPGCNADAAAQFTVAMMLSLCSGAKQSLSGQTVGIIGVGNVGGRVKAILDTLGINTLCYDPFKQAEQSRVESQFVDFDAVLQADILTLHTPLTRDGDYPTHHMINADVLARMHKHTMLINCARGAVIDGDALLADIKTNKRRVALDVWPEEPTLNNDLVNAVTLATPHVAGYSVEGKVNGTTMIYRAFCKHFGLSPATPTLDLPPPTPLSNVDMTGLGAIDALTMLTQHTTDLAGDDARLRQITNCANDEKPAFFDGLRKQYAPRREWSAHTLPPQNNLDADALATLVKLGFQTS